MAPRLGILAGGGTLPRRLIDACRSAGRDVFVLAFENHADPSVIGDAPHGWVRLGAVGTALRMLREHDVGELVMAGPVGRPSLGDLRPDAKALAWLSKGLLRKGDDQVLRTIIGMLEDEGFSVVGAHEVLNGDIAPAGRIGALAPDDLAAEDIRRGVEVARALGAVDVGQAVVVQQGIVLGVEAADGTDALLRRCGSLRREGLGGVLVKLAKPGQDTRADLPTIGPGTVRAAAACGLRGLAMSAGLTLLLSRDETVAAADAAGLFLVGIDSKT